MDCYHRNLLPVDSLTAAGEILPMTTPPSVKRRRNPIACNDCRQRKSRCDGRRPTCSSCLGLNLDCKYQELAPQDTRKRRTDDRMNLQLTEKIKVLEARLLSLSGETVPEEHRMQGVVLTENASGRPATQSSRFSPGKVPVTHIDGNTGDEEAVDILATAAFNEEPQIDIGCFGPSSNHAFFRALSGIFARTAHICSPIEQHSMRRWARSHYTRAQTRPSTPPELQTSIGLDNEQEIIDICVLPREQDAIMLINHFFATVGLVLPFLNKSTLVAEYNQARRQSFHNARRDFLALLNIVWAHASSSLRLSEAVTFYRRALGLLDERILRGTSPKLVQVLLLVGSFQQNNQRSVASWTPHALAVKASFQLGLHSPRSYQDLALQESELRKRIWYSVVNDDRFLSISLGRPGLIPSQYVRVERPQEPHSISWTSNIVSPDLTDSLIYFNYLISLCSIAGSTIELLYDHNIDSVGQIDLQDLISRRIQLSWQLNRWRQSLSTTFDIVATGDLEDLGSTSFDAKRFRILLSIMYHRILLLIDRPIITAFLALVTKERKNEMDIEFLLEAVVPVVRNDIVAANELQSIIHAITTSTETFLDRNAAWWMCNYSMFTVSLHLFGILLGCKHHDALLSISSIAEIRLSLDKSLETMRVLQRTSLMSHKARRCLLGLLEVFDSFTSEQQDTPTVQTTAERPVAAPVGPSSFPGDLTAENYVSQYIASSTNEFLNRSSNDDFLPMSFDFLYPYDSGSLAQ